MSKGPQLPDEEHELLVALLREWKLTKTWRAIGLSLGYPRDTAQQTISRVAKDEPTGRIGSDLAARIYAHLGTTREAFLRQRGLTHLIDRHPEVQPMAPAQTQLVVRLDRDRVHRVAKAVGVSEEAADKLLVAAYKGEITDEQIAAMLGRPPQTKSGIIVRQTPGGSALDELGPGTKGAAARGWRHRK